MAFIEHGYIEQLQNAGLMVSEPYPSHHAAYPGGVFVGKPTSTTGHHLTDYKFHWWDFHAVDEPPTGIEFDAPCLWLHGHDGRWFITMTLVFSPSRAGPGDFVNEWDCAQDAVEDILELYFGDSSRMQTIQQAYEMGALRKQQAKSNESPNDQGA